jgi:OmcA/MtrC family decaheme c-type cytochrome
MVNNGRALREVRVMPRLAEQRVGVVFPARGDGVMRRSIILLLGAVLMIGLQACSSDGDDGATGATGDTGSTGPAGPPGDTEPTTAVETCIGCHGPTGVVPVGNILDTDDPHFIDTDPDGPLTAAGYRQIQVGLTLVDVTGMRVVIEFDASDENGAPVDNLFASDGRFTIARLDAPVAFSGDSSVWSSLITRVEDPGTIGTGDGSPEIQADSEGFGTIGGLFENLTGGAYRYSSFFDPTSTPVMDGDSMRVAIQISAGDLPAGNGWCDFDANLVAANDCVSIPELRDIVQTAVCNDCHGVTSEVKLAVHGGGRTDVEYCVTCHNPGTIDANSDNVLDFKQMIHKIHNGAELAAPYQIWGFRNSLHDYSTVEFTKEIDNCTHCHQGAGAEVDNWSNVPTIEACGSCHDNVDFASGANHGGGVQTSNEFCGGCHPKDGAAIGVRAPVETVHRGVARAAEGSLYAGGGNGYQILALDFTNGVLTINWSVRRNGIAVDVQIDDEWNAGGASRLHFDVGWSTSDYTNEGSGAPPARAFDIDALDFVGSTMPLVGGVYQTTKILPAAAEGTIAVGMEGHPAADLDGDTIFTDRIAVGSVVAYISAEGGRAVPSPRRQVVDSAKCSLCHDSSGQGISLHGQNRTGDTQICAICHNANNTDINQRPADPMLALDGKKEEAIDFKRMIHQIHSGAELEEGVVIYGFGGNPHDYRNVEFIGNLMNCETCHVPGAYETMDANDALATTIDSGADVADPGDDLNISSTAAVCSACHDSDVAEDHMKLHGASFQALEDDIL